MTTSDDQARQALGWGAAATLVSAADLVRDISLAPRANGALDLACVVGAANLGQDLALALTTRLGADPLDPGFGFDGMSAFTTNSTGVMVREQLRASVSKLVAQDPRVRTVTAVDVDDDATSIASRTLTLDVEVDTIVGNGTVVTTTLVT